MMGAYILMLHLHVAAINPSGDGITMQEFSSKERCEKAVLLFKKETGRRVKYVCVPK